MAIPATHSTWGHPTTTHSRGGTGTKEPLLPLLCVRNCSQRPRCQHSLQDHHFFLHCCTPGNAFHCQTGRHYPDKLFLGISIIRYLAGISFPPSYLWLLTDHSGLRASNAEFQSASYMIVSQLSSCATLIPALTTKLIRTILKHAVASSLPQALLCIVCICQTQPSPVLPSRAIDLLSKQK